MAKKAAKKASQAAPKPSQEAESAAPKPAVKAQDGKSKEEEPDEDEEKPETPFDDEDEGSDDGDGESDDTDDDEDSDEDDTDDLDDDEDSDWDDDEDSDDWEDDDDEDDGLDDDEDDDSKLATAAKIPTKGAPMRRPTQPTGRMFIEDLPFPPPPAHRLQWDKFGKYWQSVYDNPKLRPRLRLYVYRMFPIMLQGHSQVAKLVGDPAQGEEHMMAKPLTLQDVLRRWGSGSYSFRLNDAGAPRSQKEVCMCVLEGKAQLNDYDHFPPVVDIAKVDPDNPANASYVKSMKARTNWDSDEEREETMKEIVQLMGQMMESQRAQTKEGSRDNNAAVDTVAYAARTAMDMVREQKGSQGSSADPTAMMAAFMGMFKEMAAAAKQDDGSSKLMMQMLLEARESEKKAQAEYSKLMADTMKSYMELMTKQQVQPQPNPGDGSTERLSARLEELKLLRDMGREFGRGGSSASSGTDWADIASKLLPVLLPLAQTAQAAFAAMAKQHGANPAALPAVQQPAPPPPPAPTDPIPGAESLPPEFRTPAAIEAFMTSLKDPLVRAINDTGQTGMDFADWYIDWKGEEHYMALRSMGPDNLLQMLEMFPPIWEHLSSRRERVLQFLTEFCVDPPEDDSEEPGDETEASDSTPTAVDTATATPVEDQEAPRNPFADAGAQIQLRRRQESAVALEEPPAEGPVIDVSSTPAPKPARKKAAKKKA